LITTTTRQHTLRQHLPGATTVRAASSVEHQAALASRLTSRDKWLLALLHEHRVLTSAQVLDAAFPSGRSARQRLRELYLWRAVSRFQPFQQLGSAPMHYVLGPAGAAVLAAEHGLEVKELGYRHDRAMAIAHNQRLAHTVGVADFFTSMIARTRYPPTDSTATTSEAVTAWWSETRCARHFGDLVIPDAYGRWRTHHGEIEFFLEFDTGTESLTKLSRKLAAYARLADSTGIATPVLVWLPTTRREAGARTALARIHAELEHREAVPVATAAADLLTPGARHPSPADEVWLPLTAGRTLRSSPRFELGELPAAWPRLAPPMAAGPAGEVAESGEDKASATAYRLPAPRPIPPEASPNRLRRTDR
jgi:hypothetical protein